MAHDVFISHSSKDKTIADAVCAALEAAGMRCWIAPRDIRSGQEWPEAIVNAISTSRVMVLIFSANSNNSKDVAKELTLAMNSSVIVIPFKIDDITPKGVMQYYLSNTHWLDAMNPPTARHIQELVETVGSLAGGEASIPAAPSGSGEATVGPANVTEPAQSDGPAVAISPGWFWAGAVLLVVWLTWTVALLLIQWAEGWGDDSWFINYFVFLTFTVPLLAPAAYCLWRGMDDRNETVRGTIANWWWMIPAVFGFAGGIVSWKKHSNTNRRTALNMLALGIVLTPLWAIPLVAFQTAAEVSTRPEANIGLIGNWPTSREAGSVFVSGDTVFIANGEDGLTILDISDLSSPQKIGAHPLDFAKNVVVNNNIAYVTEQGQMRDGRAPRDKLVLIDVKNPTNPRKLGEYEPEGDFIHRQLNYLAVSGHMAYLTVSNRMIIVDVSTPAEPVTIGEFRFSSNISSPGVAVVDGIAYLQANRLHVVDVRNPAEPVEIGGFDSGWGSSISVKNQIAYIAGWDDGLTVLDVSTPSRPIKLGQYRGLVSNYELPPGASGRQIISNVSVNGDFAYVTYHYGVDHGTWTNILESGFIAFDVSDPGDPKIIDVYSKMDEVSGIFATDDLIFATDKTRGLYIFSKTGS